MTHPDRTACPCGSGRPLAGCCGRYHAGERGWVHFRATFREGRRWSVLEESSRFVREAGHWFYLDGSPVVHRLKPGRNTPCPCGSGRKFKACCGLA